VRLEVLPGLATPFVVAHAGGSVLADGDVFAGIDRAVDAGVPVVELDVRRTRDDALVVHHGGRPGEQSLADRRLGELGPSVPPLADVLAHVGDRAAVNLELKEAGYESHVLALALDHVERECLVITSFLDDALRGVRHAAGDVATGLLVGRRPVLRSIGQTISDLVPFGRVEAAGADFLAPSHQLDVVAIRPRAAARGIPVLLWTVNDPEKLQGALADRRLLGVVTDNYVITRRT
jgi:glycerophosphoryl diester phosphodiesterase